MKDVSKMQMELEDIKENDIKDMDPNEVYECFGRGRVNESLKRGGKTMMFVTWHGKSASIIISSITIIFLTDPKIVHIGKQVCVEYYICPELPV